MEHTQGDWAVEIVGKESTGHRFLKADEEIKITCDDGLYTLAVMGAYWGQGLAHKNAQLMAYAPKMYERLKEIAEGKGAYSMDRMTHAENTIRDMKALAEGLIDEIKKKLISQKRCASCTLYGEIGGGDWVPYGATQTQLPFDYGCKEDLDVDDCGEPIDTSFCLDYKELPRCPYHPGEHVLPGGVIVREGCELCMEEAYREMAEEDEDVPR